MPPPTVATGGGGVNMLPPAPTVTTTEEYLKVQFECFGPAVAGGEAMPGPLSVDIPSYRVSRLSLSELFLAVAFHLSIQEF